MREPAPDELSIAARFSGAIARYASLPASADDSAGRLRTERKEAWLAAAVPSVLGTAPAADVCSFWSDVADDLLRKAFAETFGEGVALFALGKLGSGELNLSSDVDILFVAREEKPEHLSSLRRFQKLLADVTPLGFVHRVDFDLRPGGRQGPLVPTVDHFVDYYGNYGETWERMAFVRLRPIAGDESVAQEVMGFASRFSYRRHLDFTLLEELKLLRAKIHAEHWRRGEGGRIDLKLAVGGIRDVELFIHALQVLHGGKDPGLRIKGTTAAARALRDKNLLPAGDADFLVEHYWNLRALENYVQAVDDRQTHILDPNGSFPEHVTAKLAGLTERMEETNRIVSTLLGEPPTAPSADDLRARTADEDWREALDEILEIPLLSRNRERDERTRRALLEKFLNVLDEQGGDKKMAVEQLKDFLKSTRAKASFLTLLLRQDNLLRELAWLFGHSRYLGGILCFRPELLDAFIYRAQDLETEDFERLLDELAEKRLLSEIIEGSRFLRDQDIGRTTSALSSAADEIVRKLATSLREQYPSEARMLALGKWGGSEIGFRSDLDLIFVHPGEPNEDDLRFVRRMVSRLTDTHRGGRIYPIDLRLRPSGKAGPLVIGLAELHDYLENTAAPWERQAYLRARWVDADWAGLGTRLIQKPLTSDELSELDRIRRELLPKDIREDLKYSEGGLLDLELASQALALVRQVSFDGFNTLAAWEQLGEPRLREIYYRLRQCEQMLQLSGSHTVTRVDQNPELIQNLARMMKKADAAAFRADVRALLDESRERLARLDPRRSAR